ncbi:MAG TPA: polysaccharide lyase family 7 protein, partial [Pseudonocardiaceae bacterium]|nr:polysaccharide lyase family 7 protein [Pseudonocardiaceae bacterium]
MAHGTTRVGAGLLALASALAIGMGSTSPAGAQPISPQLNKDVAPGGNFALSDWELELPTGSTGNTTTISPAQLKGSNGFQDKYFYTSPSDGSMTFWDPENGVTLGSKYPRTELREMTSSGKPAEWDPATGTHTLSATLSSDKVPDHVCVGQIHDDNSSPGSKPLLELYYYTSGEIKIGLEQT